MGSRGAALQRCEKRLAGLKALRHVATDSARTRGRCPCSSTYRHAGAESPFSRRAQVVIHVRVAAVITRDSGRAAVVLVVEDVEEIRDGLEKLLTTDGSRVDPARREVDAIDRA